MTVPQIKVKIQRRAQIKFRALPRFPADVTAASPILLTRTGSNYAFSFDVDALQESLDEVYAAAGDIVDLQATIDGVGGIHPDDPRFGAIRDGSTNTTAEIIEAAEYAASNRLGLFLESGSGGYATTPIQFGGSNPATGTFTGEISGTTLTVTTTPTIPLVRGQSLSGTGVTAGTTIVDFGADTEGWIGTYTVSASQTVSSTTITATAPSITASFSGTTMTVSAIANGKLFPVDSLVGTGITGGTTIVAQLTGSTGSTGTYTISHPHSLSSRTVRAYPYTLASLPDFILGAPGGQTASVVKAYGSATSPNALWRIVNPAALGAVLGFEIGHIRFDANSIYGTALQFHGFGATSSGGVPHAHDITVSNATNVGMSAVGNVVSAASWGVIEANFTRISGNGNAVTDFHFNGNDGDGTFNSQSITLLDCKANSASSGPGWWFDYTNVVAISCLSQNHTGNALTVNHCNHFEWIDFYSEANGGPFTGDATNSKGVKITGQLIDGVNSALLTSATADIDYNVVGGTRVRNAGVITTQAAIAVSPDAGTGKVGASVGAGLQLMGRGSVYDVAFYNWGGTLAGGVLTGTTTVNFIGLQVNGKALSLAGDLTTSGAYASTFTMTGVTSVTFPTTGTLASLSVSNTWTAAQALTINQNAATIWSVNNNSAGTSATATYQANNGTNVASFGIGGTGYTGSSSIFLNRAFMIGDAGVTLYAGGSNSFTFYNNNTLTATLSTAGLVLATPLSPASGGTGVANNAASTITISGSFGTTFTVTGTTSITLPTTGALASLSISNTWTAAQALTINQNAATIWSVNNNSAGTSATATYQANNGTNIASFGIGGTGYTGSSSIFLNRAFMIGDAGVTLYAGGANSFTFYNNATLTATLSTAGLVLATPLAAASGGTGLSALGTGVATALGHNVGSAGAPVTFNGALGTPSSGTATNLTGLPISTGVSGLGTGVATFLATASSANLRSALTDEVSSTAASPKALFGTAGSLPATATNDSATAGSLGEYISSSVASGSAVSVSPTSTIIDITSISLTAGDWDVWGTVATVVAGGAILTRVLGTITETSVTFPTNPNGGGTLAFSFSGTTENQHLPIGQRRISVASTTTIYLTGSVDFTVGTCKMYGFIGARRVR